MSQERSQVLPFLRGLAVIPVQWTLSRFQLYSRLSGL